MFMGSLLLFRVSSLQIRVCGGRYEIVAGRIDHSVRVVMNEGGEAGAIDCEDADGGFFLLAHEAPVARAVGTQDSAELALNQGLLKARYFLGELLTLQLPATGLPH